MFRRRATAIFLCLLLLGVAASCGRTTLKTGPAGQGGDSAGGQGPGGQGPGGQGGVGLGGQGGVGPGGQGGGGIPNVCTTDFECDDVDFCTTDRCVAGSCDFELKDDDDDGFVDELCGGVDCNDLNPNVFPGHIEVCTDAADNDCNGVADCFDPACLLAPSCGCVPAPGGEQCTNNQDDDCDTTVDCNDADCIGTPDCGCTPNENGLCSDGIDNDCDTQIDCDDSDCAGSTNCTCQAIVELCGNSQDEDCDLLIDCADPDCFGAFECICTVPTPEVCNDNVDNDCDMAVDCADTDCAISPSCQNCMPEVCNDNIDNDCDNLIDCADDACNFAPNCMPQPEICNNSLDDDNDTFIDCDDPDCSNNPFCLLQQSNCNTARLISGSGTYFGDTEGNVNHHSGACGGGAGEAVFYFVLSQPSFVHLDTIGTTFDSVLHVRFGDCDNGAEIGCDDDSGGFQWSALLEFTILYPGTYYVFVDGFTVDPNFGANDGPFTFNVTITPNPPEICNDGLDNDGDVYIDCGDPDCVSAPGCLNCNNGGPPSAEFGTGNCTDGLDNDCDGDFDCDDSDCSASPYAITECCNGQDQNDNGIPDDFSCRCANTNECDNGQICYTGTTHTCGFPCTQFFGNVCPSVALGSVCNTTTGQCQF